MLLLPLQHVAAVAFSAGGGGDGYRGVFKYSRQIRFFAQLTQWPVAGGLNWLGMQHPASILEIHEKLPG